MRRYDLDWLRVMGILAVFLFHCAHIFDPFPYHVKSPDSSMVAAFFVAFVWLWIMPLFFLVAGSAAWASLARRSVGRFIKERLLRLAVPMYTAGIFLLLPPQAYLDGLTSGRVPTSIGFLQYYPRYFAETFSTSLSPEFLYFWPGHLWFLWHLLVISIVLAPLLAGWRKQRIESGKGLTEKVARTMTRKGGALLPAAVMAPPFAVLTPLLPGQHTWADFVMYTVFFLTGAVLMAEKEAMASLQRQWRLLLVAALVSTLAYFWIILSGRAMLFTGAGYSVWTVGLAIANAMGAWCWVALLSVVAQRFLNRPFRGLQQANEAVLPFYLLHQTVLLVVAWYVVVLDTPLWFRFILVSGGSFFTIIALYAGCIRPFSFMRVAFGMRAGPRRGTVEKGQGPGRRAAVLKEA